MFGGADKVCRCAAKQLAQVASAALASASASAWEVGARAKYSTRGSQAVIALGSNLGNRVQNIWKGIRSLAGEEHTNILEYASLYETAPAYYEDQGDFINTAVLVETSLQPLDLLRHLKHVEKILGREFNADSIRFGPRPIDLDVIFYGEEEVNEAELEVPHPRWRERPFVLAPLSDLHSFQPGEDPPGRYTCARSLESAATRWSTMGGELLVGRGDPVTIRRVTPIIADGSHKVVDFSQKTHVMGILNVTPDSFSDGGSFSSQDSAVAQFQRLVDAGADIVDIGGQSTRPGATLLTAEEEADRVLPVIEQVVRMARTSPKETLISVDTFHASVARQAVSLGAHMVNDVSSGALDPGMHPLLASELLGVPCVMMHMRGDPQTMQNEEHTQYGDVARDVADELSSKVHTAVHKAGVMPWCILPDPGFGFAKTHSSNLALLRGLSALRASLTPTALRNSPMVVGPSRKGFLGTATGRGSSSPAQRDAATCAAITMAAAQAKCEILRVHNVDMASDAAKLVDAVRNAPL